MYGIQLTQCLERNLHLQHKYFKRRNIFNQSSDLHLKTLGKEEHTNPKANRRKKRIKIRMEINKMEDRKTTEKINGTKW